MASVFTCFAIIIFGVRRVGCEEFIMDLLMLRSFDDDNAVVVVGDGIYGDNFQL